MKYIIGAVAIILLIMTAINAIKTQDEIRELQTQVIYWKRLFEKTKEERDKLLKAQKLNIKKYVRSERRNNDSSAL